jgi:hypothetical protein
VAVLLIAGFAGSASAQLAAPLFVVSAGMYRSSDRIPIRIIGRPATVRLAPGQPSEAIVPPENPGHGNFV